MTPRESWGEELESAFIYRGLAASDGEAEHRALFAKLAAEAEKQAAMWARHLQPELPAFRPSVRARAVVALVRWFGGRRLSMVLAAMKVRGMSVYGAAPATGHPMHRPVGE